METDNIKILAKGSGIILLCMVFSKVFGYIYRLIIARIGIEQYGNLCLGIIIISIVVMLSTLGLDFGIFRYVSFFIGKKDDKNIKKVINSSLKISIPTSIFFSLLLFIFSDKIAYVIFNNLGLGTILKILSISIPFTVLATIFLSALIAFKKVKYFVYAKYISENILKILITLILIILGYGIIGATVAYVLAMVSGFILSFYFLNKKVFSFLSKGENGFFSNKVLLLFSLPILFSNLIGLVIEWISSIMIGIFQGVYFVGIYNSALPTSLMLFTLPAAFTNLFVPILGELFAKNKKIEIIDTYKLTTRWIFLLNFPLFLLMVFFSKQILSILFGSEYSIGYSSLIILCLGYFIYSIFYINQQILFVIKKTNLILINSIIAACLNIILNYFLILKYNIVGGAIATAITLIVLSILCFIESNLFIKLKSDLISYIKYIICGIIAIILIYTVNKTIIISIYFLELIILSVIFCLCYFGLIILMKGLDKEDLYIISIIKNKFKKI